jgi:uncharacterized protein
MVAEMQVLVVAKEPVAGRVKTRLCPPCTHAQAAAVAEAALADTLDAAVASGADRVVLALDGRRGPWCPPGVRVVSQGAGVLARRLSTAWSQVTSGPTLQIGMDTPHVGAAGLDSAMAALAAFGVDAVLGPACDGGWWAVGMQRPDPEVFLGVPTSRADTGARQRARLARQGTVVDLWAVRDLDTWADVVAAGYDARAGVAISDAA